MNIPGSSSDDWPEPHSNPSPGRVEDDDDVGDARPFDPRKVKIETKPMTLAPLIQRMREGRINLAPEFQRQEVWKLTAKSRLIESLLIRIPLPAFYMDASDENSWVVVDGLQRLCTLRDFVVPHDEGRRLILQDLEYLKDLEGKSFHDLHRPLQRRIEETEIIVFLIEKGTPCDLKFNLFKRINTGGLPLSSQEIRHALHQGPATRFLKELARTDEFLRATGGDVADDRMQAREYILHALAFLLTPYTAYAGDFNAFLGETMVRMNNMSDQELASLRNRFMRAMVHAEKIFGEQAFRKPTKPGDRVLPISRALFEVWSVGLDSLSDDELASLVARKDVVVNLFAESMHAHVCVHDFSNSASHSERVKRRFQDVEKMIWRVLSA
ncbi:MAG: DUF262 domain-containing protein [Magnetococcales bacterium]|nr:DUF262 domain-containing protein [Magnetococcales bacterium]